MNLRTPYRASLSILLPLVLAAFVPAQVGDKGAKNRQAKPAAASKTGATRKAATEDGGAAPARTRTRETLPIAIVDMDEAARHAKSHDSGREILKAMQRTFEAKLKKIEDQIERLKLVLGPMIPSPEKTEQTLQLRSLLGRLRLAGDIYNSEINRQSVKNAAATHRDVLAVVRELAQKRGIYLVLRKHGSATVAAMMAEALTLSEAAAFRIQSDSNRNRSVLYAAAGTDITAAVIKILKGK